MLVDCRWRTPDVDSAEALGKVAAPDHPSSVSVFGLQGATFDFPRVKALYHVPHRITKIIEVVATPPVNIFPILKYLHGMGNIPNKFPIRMTPRSAAHLGVIEKEFAAAAEFLARFE